MITFRRYLSLLFVFLAASLPSSIVAKEDEKLHIGILAFRGIESTQQQWQETLHILNQSLPQYSLEFHILFMDDMTDAVYRNELDFVLTQPEHYILMRSFSRMSVAATLLNSHENQPLARFAGVIAALSDRSDLNSLDAIRGQRIASAHANSLGAYRIQHWTLNQAGIRIPKDIQTVTFTGQPQDKAIALLLDKQVDIAFVRSGVIESMIQSGQLTQDQLRIINAQDTSELPLMHSTQLIPEWAFAAMPSIDPLVVRDITQALFSIQPDSIAARSGGYYGFAPPVDYASLESILLELRVHPDRISHFDMRDFVEKYLLEISIALGCAIVLGSVWVACDIRRRKKYAANLRIAAAAFSTNEAITITNEKNEILRVNSAFTQITGYSEAEVVGRNPSMFSSGYHPPEFYKEMWSALNTAGHWEGEIWNRRKNGEIFPEHLNITKVRGVHPQSFYYVASFSDITQVKESKEQIEHLHLYDQLTGLANIDLLRDRISSAITRTQLHETTFALILIDLKNFKFVNESLGRRAGDQLLCGVAERLTEALPVYSSLARLAADEFVIICEYRDQTSEQALFDIEHLIVDIQNTFITPFSIQGKLIYSQANLGVVYCANESCTADELLKRADLAKNQSKFNAQTNVSFFDPLMQEQVNKVVELENDLRHAIDQNQLELYFQPQYDINRSIIGCEALIRWLHPTKGVISPAEFIPLAESTELILLIGDFVISTACQTLATWQVNAFTNKWTLAINISARQFQCKDFVDRVMQHLRDAQAPANRLKLELTESLLIDYTDEAVEKMSQLKKVGVHFSLDDFGTGFSSLSYLKKLPFDQIKVDKAFIHDLIHNHSDEAIIRSVLAMGKAFDMNVIAEGVETEQQLQKLQELGCYFYQGFYFSKPMSGQKLQSWMGQ
ncbi:EAL domain-containing protein [Nitrincola alkalisediminis]|uniref:EAL domain-containing protein n=1 Tax=Nitrincola alkalisediminis TaxID=1366656 RepID=UPI0018771449|nr:EAL domain-containing protein [Nitrincola alkalisediminis]